MGGGCKLGERVDVACEDVVHMVGIEFEGLGRVVVVPESFENSPLQREEKVITKEVHC